MDAGAGAGLVDDVDGLVRQEAILDVAAGEHGSRGQGLVGIAHMMVLLVALAQPLEDHHSVCHGGLVDVDGLEAALEG